MFRSLPRIVDAAGHEILPHLFDGDASRMFTTIFRKGASWPISFDEPSHVIDVAVWLGLCAWVAVMWAMAGQGVVVYAMRNKLIAYARTRPSETFEELGEPYLTRYYLFGRVASSKTPASAERLRWLPTVRVHHFHRADSGRAPHNHPWWWALSVVLSGSYVEARGRKPRWVRPPPDGL